MLRQAVFLLGLTLPLASAGAYEISGIVGDASYKRLEGVVVTLEGAAEAADTTDAEGRYAFTGLDGGDYAVEPAYRRGHLLLDGHPVRFDRRRRVHQRHKVLLGPQEQPSGPRALARQKGHDRREDRGPPQGQRP